MAVSIRVQLVLFCTLTYLGFVDASKLNVPRVLLPIFNQFSSNFTLEVTESGCYKWTSSRFDIVQVNPINVDEDLHCSTHAVVSAITKEATRNTAIILAEEVHSGQVLRCDVIVDVIFALNIVTTTRELFMEEAPEAFEVRAYDDQGNEFTTLEGVEFQWSLGNWNAKADHSGSSSSNNVLRFITFRDSPYETPTTIEAFEQRGLRGHMVLLEGIKTGSAKVTVRLPHTEYQHVPVIEVQLMVVANLIIDPPDVYCLRGDIVHYRILQVQHGRLVEIPMPSQQYYLEIEDPTIATIEEESANAAACKLGKTKVLLHDRNVDETEAGIKIPSASFTVCEPAYLTLAILPHRNWAVMLSEHYEIVVEVYDSADHKLHIGEGVNVEAVIPEQYFHVEESTTNNTHHTGWPVEVGSCEITATLESVTDPAGTTQPLSPKISAAADMSIYYRICIEPAEVVLPWDPTIKSKYEVLLKASGGDGAFLWSSSNCSTATVTQSGLVKTLTHGSVEVTAAMARNHHNLEKARVHILPPRHLEIVEYVLEAEVGTPIHLHLALFADRPVGVGGGELTLMPFTRCKDLPFRVSTSERTFVHDLSASAIPVGISCATVAVVGTSAGTSRITVSYDRGGGPNPLEDSITVAAYEPLVPLHPASGQTVLALGTSRRVVFTGGPRPWPGRSSEHVRRVSVGDDTDRPLTAIEMHGEMSSPPDVYAYEVTCHKLGSVVMKLVVTNTPALKHCKRAEAEATVTVHCAKPRYVSLRPNLKIPEGSSCPMNLNAERVVAQTYKDIELTVTVKDEHGRKFDNISSLYIDWDVSNPTLADIAGGSTSSTLTETLQDGDVITPVRDYQNVTPKGLTGSLEVTATIVGYHNNILKQQNIEPEYPPFGIINEKGEEVSPVVEATVTLILVNDTVISPNRTSLFNHPSNTAFLQVSQGSGFYEFVLSSDDIADVKYSEGTRVIEIVPKESGLLRVALVDLCLISRPAMVEVQVVGVGSIRVDSPDRVERGKCMTAVVRLYDPADNQLSLPDPSLLELRAYPESAIVDVKPRPAEGRDSDKEAWYTISGLELGDTSVIFSAGQGRREVQSQPAHVQVFPPLRLFPRNVTLVAGAIFQVTSRGGPQPDSNIEYTVAGSVASVNRAGVVEGIKYGHTTLTGRAIGYNSISGQRMVFSQDSIEVHVVPLKGIKVHAPIARIRTGATMPVWASGVPDQISPLMLGAARIPLVFKWAVESRDIGVLRNVFYETGVDIHDEDKITMRFTALKPGRTIIYLNVTCPAALTVCPDKLPANFRDSIEVEVFEELRLTRPIHASGPQTPLIIIAPETSVQLKTNRDAECHMEYTLLDSGAPGFTPPNPDSDDISRALANTVSVVKINDQGLVTSHGQPGLAVIIVSAREDFGLKQILTVTIEVKPISYMMLNVHSKVQMNAREKVNMLPQGLQIELSVSFHDNTGAVFTSSRSDLKMRTNRFDLTQLTRGEENGTVYARLLHSGKTMLKVWDDASLQHVADFIKIPTGDIIFPDKTPLTVGDVVCFSAPLQQGEASSGQNFWSTDNENVLKVHRESGVGIIQSSGFVMVQYHLSSEDVINTDLEVLPLHAVTFLADGDQNVSNSDLPFKFPLVLSPEGEKSKTKNLVARGGNCDSNETFTVFPFTCEMSFTTASDSLEVLAIYPDFCMATGVYYCTVISAGPATLETSLLQTDVSIRAVANGISSEPLVIPFNPAVYVLTQEVQLSNLRSSGVITISGIPDVLAHIRVVAEPQQAMTVGPMEMHGPTTMSYHIYLSSQYSMFGDNKNLMVVVHSELTRQAIQIPVKLRMSSSKSWANPPCLVNEVGSFGSPVADLLYSYRFSLIATISILVIVMTTIYAYLKFIQPLTVGMQSQHDSVLVPSQPIFSSTQESNASIRSPFADTNPVYGDPRLSFQSPDVRRNRRFL